MHDYVYHNHIKYSCIIWLEVHAQLKMTNTFPRFSVIVFLLSDKFFILATFFNLVVTNVCLLPKSEYDLPITMSDPNLEAFMQTHWIIYSRITNSWFIYKYFPTSTWTSPGLASIDTIASKTILETPSGCTRVTTYHNKK